MMRVTSIGMLVVALLAPSGVGAAQQSGQEAGGASGTEQGDTKIHFMNVEIWPEYDDPRVLVIYRGALEPDLATPRDFSFLVPTGAEIHMAGAIDENGGHVHGLYTTEDRGDGLTEVSYSLPNPTFYMEFYYDPLGDDDLRDFTYPLVSPFPITQLLVSVQHPRRADEFAVTPVSTRVVQDEQGLSYHVVGFDSLAAGESESVSVRYRKSDREFSVAAQDAAGAGADPEGADKRAMKGILIFAAGLLLLVIVYGVFTSTQKSAAREARTAPGARTTRSYGGPPRALSSDARFCTQCGEGITATDKFCRACGHPARPGAPVA
jgi:zinc ribbon protein